VEITVRRSQDPTDIQALVRQALDAGAEAVADIDDPGERQLKGMARPVGVTCLRALKRPSS
jgi:adenylate cyclase